jgi:hypothetical protein
MQVVLRMAVALIGIVFLYGLAEYQRKERTEEGIRLLAPNATVTNFQFREGTNRFFLRTQEGDEITILYVDHRTDLGRPETDFAVESLDGYFPHCEPYEERDKYHNFLQFVEYAKLTEFSDRLYDFSSLMKNTDDAKRFIVGYFGPDRAHPKIVEASGIKFNCFLRSP